MENGLGGVVTESFIVLSGKVFIIKVQIPNEAVSFNKISKYFECHFTDVLPK